MAAVPECPVVLLADDNEDDVFLIRRAFTIFNRLARVLNVADGQAVLAYLQGTGAYADPLTRPLPSILILDQSMPYLSGGDALVWLRTQEEFRALPVVVLSGGLSPIQLQAVTALKAVFCAKA